MLLQSFEVNYYGSRFAIHIKILIFTILLARDQKSHLQPFSPKQIAKLRDKIARWKYISENLLIKSKTIEQSYYQWLSFLTTMLKMPAPVKLCLNSIKATTPKLRPKKTLISTQNLALLTN